MSGSSREFSYAIGFDDIDTSLLPADARTVGTDQFRAAITQWLTDQYRHLGGRARIVVNDVERRIDVRWTNDSSFPSPAQVAMEMLERNDLAQAVPLLEVLIRQEPSHAQHFVNLGMALSDQGKLERSKQMLRAALMLAPRHVDARVALGVAYAREGAVEEAIEELQAAIQVAPDNGWAHRNLAACLLKVGRPTDALAHFERACELLPNAPPVMYGMAQCLEQLERADDADNLYLRIIELAPHTPIADAAKAARTKLAEASFRRKGIAGERPDAVMYLLSAIERFEKMPIEEVKRIGFEVAMLGMKGLDTNDSRQKYSLQSLPGAFSGLHLVCLMYAAFKKFAPREDIGFDLSEEYATALSMFKRQS